MIVRATVPNPSRMKTGQLATVLAMTGLAVLGFPRHLVAAPVDAAPVDAASANAAGGDAAGSDDADGAARVAKAEAAFNEGRALLQQGRAREACARLEESQSLDPGLGTQLNLANCYEQLRRFASAHALFVEVAAAAHAQEQDEREQVARARATALETKVSQLVIVVPAAAGAQLRIERDGRELPRGEWNVLVPVDPGVHRVRAWGPGVGEWSTEVGVSEAGELHEVAIPIDDARPFLAPLHRKFGLAAAGVGVAGVLVGSFFGLRAIAKKSDAERAGCDGRQCDSQGSGALRDEARSAGNVATVAMGIGAASLGAAAVLFWVVPEPAPEGLEDGAFSAQLQVSPQIFPRGGGLWLSAGF